MKLKKLVAPLELCKLIPKGEFEDSAFQWQEATVKGKVCVDIVQHYPFGWQHPEWATLYPAPTLEEIIEFLPIGYYPEKVSYALELWLEQKGIEYENV